MVSLFPKEQTVEVTRGERLNAGVEKMKSIWGREVETLRRRQGAKSENPHILVPA